MFSATRPLALTPLESEWCDSHDLPKFGDFAEVGLRAFPAQKLVSVLGSLKAVT